MKFIDYLSRKCKETEISLTYKRFKHQTSLFDQRYGIADTMARRNLRKAIRLGLTYVLEAEDHTIREEDKKLLGRLIVKSSVRNP
jgi:hypothetical protein